MDPNHALLVGMVWAALQKEFAANQQVLAEVEFIRDDQGFTNEMWIIRPSGRYKVTVHPVDNSA